MNRAVLLGNTHIFDASSGEFVSAKHMRLAEIIHDFDSGLELRWVPPKQRGHDYPKPYAVMHIHKDLPEPYVIMYLDESQLDQGDKVIAALFEARRRAQGRVGSLADMLEDMDRAKELMRAKERLDEYEEAADKARFLWNTPKHTVNMDGKVLHL